MSPRLFRTLFMCVVKVPESALFAQARIDFSRPSRHLAITLFALFFMCVEKLPKSSAFSLIFAHFQQIIFPADAFPGGVHFGSFLDSVFNLVICF